MRIDIGQVKAGDIVRFESYALRVDWARPGSGSITLRGRSSKDGCPEVTKHFLVGRPVEVERA